MKAGVEADLRVDDALRGHGLGVVGDHALEVRARLHRLRDRPVDGQELRQIRVLIGGGGRQAGVAVGGPCIGVVGAGQGAVYDKAALAKGVEGVFDDIVPGCARDMDKELPGEIAELEARAHLAAIDRQRSDCVSGALAPFGDDLAIAVEQRQPARDLGGAVAGPVIDRDYAAMQRPGVAEQRKIGREIEGVEIGAAVGQALLGYPHPIEAQHLRPGRQIAL